MKILQISNYYYPHVGGIEQTCEYLAEGLSDEYEVRVICFSEDKHTKFQEHNGVKITKCGVCLNVARQGLSLSYFWQLRKLLKSWKPDIIHVHYPNPFVVALLLPLIPKQAKVYVQWHLDITKQKKIYPFVKPFETMLLKRADMIAPTSPNYRDSSKPLVPFLDKTDVLPSAIEPSLLDLKEGDVELISAIKKKANGKKIIFYVGRHVPHKGLLELLEAEKFIKNDCFIYIAGNGPITEEAKHLCNSSRVEFVGRISDDEKRCYYHAADIFAFPSYTKAEGFGLTLAEAMYCHAVPVTYTIEGSGVNWVCVNGETGLEAPNRDVLAYAKSLDELLSNDDLRNSLAQAGKQRVMNLFTVKEEVATLKKQYKKILS